MKNIHLCRGGDGGFLLVLDERNREQAPTLFALPKQVWYPRVKQHLHGPLERSAHSSYIFPRNAHRFCTTQSEKDKTMQISKIQIYMVPCTCRRRGRAPFSLNFLSTDQAHASGRVKRGSCSALGCALCGEATAAILDMPAHQVVDCPSRGSNRTTCAFRLDPSLAIVNEVDFVCTISGTHTLEYLQSQEGRSAGIAPR